MLSNHCFDTRLAVYMAILQARQHKIFENTFFILIKKKLGVEGYTRCDCELCYSIHQLGLPFICGSETVVLLPGS